MNARVASGSFKIQTPFYNFGQLDASYQDLGIWSDNKKGEVKVIYNEEVGQDYSI